MARFFFDLIESKNKWIAASGILLFVIYLSFKMVSFMVREDPDGVNSLIYGPILPVNYTDSIGSEQPLPDFFGSGENSYGIYSETSFPMVPENDKITLKKFDNGKIRFFTPIKNIYISSLNVIIEDTLCNAFVKFRKTSEHRQSNHYSFWGEMRVDSSAYSAGFLKARYDFFFQDTILKEQYFWRGYINEKIL
jgi:hypothetical protein